MKTQKKEQLEQNLIIKIDALPEIREQKYKLLERDFVKNKFAEIEESKKQIISLIKWFLGISGASLAFFITNDNKKILNYNEIQALLLIFFYFGIIFIVFLETKYSFFFNKQKKLYSCIQKQDYNGLEQIVFSIYHPHYLFNIKNFPYRSFTILVLVSSATFLSKYYSKLSEIKIDPNTSILEKIITYFKLIYAFTMTFEECIYFLLFYFTIILTIVLLLSGIIFISPFIFKRKQKTCHSRTKKLYLNSLKYFLARQHNTTQNKKFLLYAVIGVNTATCRKQIFFTKMS